VAGRIKPKKIPKASIGIETRDFKACSAVTERNAPPRWEDYQVFGGVIVPHFSTRIYSFLQKVECAGGESHGG